MRKAKNPQPTMTRKSLMRMKKMRILSQIQIETEWY